MTRRTEATMLDHNLQPDERVATLAPPVHVVASELAIAPEGADHLEAAFQDRLGEVDGYPGFIHLEVWKDGRRPGRYLMITWWDSPAAFHDYLRSDAHHRSHERIPTQPARPAPVRVDQFSLIAR
jgi:heme-degrading monooxygenase HmoA